MMKIISSLVKNRISVHTLMPKEKLIQKKPHLTVDSSSALSYSELVGPCLAFVQAQYSRVGSSHIRIQFSSLLEVCLEYLLSSGLLIQEYILSMSKAAMQE